ncbi:MAG: cupin domain-containing protein [Arenicella sp.]
MVDNTDVLKYVQGGLSGQELSDFESALLDDPKLQQELVKACDTSGVNQSLKPSSELRQRLFKSINNENRFEGFISRLMTLFDLPEKSVRQTLDLLSKKHLQKEEKSHYKHLEGQGIQFIHFDGGPETAGADCGFVIIQPDIRFPAHDHSSTETSLILQGELIMDDGKSYLPGDLIVAHPGEKHSFKTISNEAVIQATVVQAITEK